MIKDNIRRLREEIALVCQRLGRNQQDITLIAVTKNASVKEIQEAIAAGITDIGENRIQEAEEKFADLKETSKIKWHLVGHLQTNKIKPALDIFGLIHSVDSIRLARQIDKEAARLGKRIDILIQVNTSKEETKFGIKPESLSDFVDSLSRMECVRLKGLMTIAPLTEDEKTIRNCFRDLRLLRERLKKEYSASAISMDYLSMGMTNDFRIALEEGSNMLRIGRAIFATTDEHRLKDID